MLVDEPFITKDSAESAQTPRPNGGKRMRLRGKVTEKEPLRGSRDFHHNAALKPIYLLLPAAFFP